MDAQTLIEEAGQRGGWNERTQLHVLARFVDHLDELPHIHESLQEYLEGRLAEEGQAADSAGPVDPALLTPAVHAEIHSDDHVYTVRNVDVTRWFATATDEELEQLWAEDWGNAEIADQVAYAVEEHNREVETLLDYCRRTNGREHSVGFEVWVNGDEAKAWIRAHRPEFWGQHCPDCGAKHTEACLGGGRCVYCGQSLGAEPAPGSEGNDGR